MFKNSIVIFGYFNSGNIGDDLMLSALLDRCKINDFLPVNNLRNIKNILKLLLAKKLYFSGGNIFSKESYSSFLKIFVFILVFKYRRLMQYSTEIFSIGLDLKQGKFWRFLVLFALNNLKNIEVRDVLSYRYLRMYSRVNTGYKYDSVYYYIQSKKSEINLVDFKENNDGIVWFISAVSNLTQENRINFLKSINKDNKKISFFCQQLDDEKIAKKMQENFLDNSRIIRYSKDKISEYISTIIYSNFVISERYHVGVMSEGLQKKWYSIGRTEKLNRLKPDSYRETIV